MSRNMNNENTNCRNNGKQRMQRCGVGDGLVMMLFIVLCAGTQAARAQDAISAAADSYAQNCAVCHGDDGTGAMPGVPDLLARRTWSDYTTDELVKRIQQGIKTPASPSGMPPNAGNPALSEPDLRLAIEHLRKLLSADK